MGDFNNRNFAYLKGGNLETKLPKRGAQKELFNSSDSYFCMFMGLFGNLELFIMRYLN